MVIKGVRLAGTYGSFASSGTLGSAWWTPPALLYAKRGFPRQSQTKDLTIDQVWLKERCGIRERYLECSVTSSR